jgi:hypothetical protein
MRRGPAAALAVLIAAVVAAPASAVTVAGPTASGAKLELHVIGPRGYHARQVLPPGSKQCGYGTGIFADVL